MGMKFMELIFKSGAMYADNRFLQSTLHLYFLMSHLDMASRT